jgi:hypothetical protein
MGNIIHQKYMTLPFRYRRQPDKLNKYRMQQTPLIVQRAIKRYYTLDEEYPLNPIQRQRNNKNV